MTDKTTEQRVYEEVVDYLVGMGYEASVYSNYSGRMMFGAQTTGLVTDAPATMVGYIFGVVLRDLEGLITVDGALEDLVPKRTDNMGRDAMIYY